MTVATDAPKKIAIVALPRVPGSRRIRKLGRIALPRVLAVRIRSIPGKNHSQGEFARRLGWAETKKVGGTFTLEGSMVGALAGEISEDDAKRMIGEVMGSLAQYSVVAALLKRQLLSPAFVKGVISERWRSPRGREYARRIALRNLPYMEHCGISYALTLHAAFHQGALPEDWTAEQEELSWKLALDML